MLYVGIRDALNRPDCEHRDFGTKSNACRVPNAKLFRFPNHGNKSPIFSFVHWHRYAEML